MGTGFEIKGDELILRINPKIYPVDRIYATAYVFLDKYYFIFDGDREKEVVLRIKPKQKADLEKFAFEFFEEMLSITNYFNQFEKNRDVINMVLQRALFSVAPQPLSKEEQRQIEKILQ